MSQSGSLLGGGGGGGSSILTITGNDGTPESPVAGNFNLLTANSTVKFLGSAATETLNFGLTNLILGTAPTVSGNDNAGFGLNCLLNLSVGSNNAAYGALCMQLATAASACSAFGRASLAACTIGQADSAFGNGALGALTTGSNNLALGNLAGSQYTTESNNICIANIGTVTDENTIRIGTQGNASGQQNQTFIVGPVLVTETGTLSNPAYSFAGDPDTGFFNSAANRIQGVAGGNEVFEMTSGSFNVTGNLNVFSGMSWTHRRSAISTNAAGTDVIIEITDTTAPRTVTLPAAPDGGKIYVIKDASGAAGTNAISVVVSGGTETIDGVTTFPINTNYGSVTVFFDDTVNNYFVI